MALRILCALAVVEKRCRSRDSGFVKMLISRVIMIIGCIVNAIRSRCFIEQNQAIFVESFLVSLTSWRAAILVFAILPARWIGCAEMSTQPSDFVDFKHQIETKS